MSAPHGDDHVLDLLHEHVPLSLLLDLVALPVGGSQVIYEQEVADLTWLDPREAHSVA
jgi:hypothetical protein